MRHGDGTCAGTQQARHRRFLACPDRYSCWSLDSAYGPYGGRAYCGSIRDSFRPCIASTETTSQDRSSCIMMKDLFNGEYMVRVAIASERSCQWENLTNPSSIDLEFSLAPPENIVPESLILYILMLIFLSL
jgi:hypothetical protein